MFEDRKTGQESERLNNHQGKFRNTVKHIYQMPYRLKLCNTDESRDFEPGV